MSDSTIFRDSEINTCRRLRRILGVSWGCESRKLFVRAVRKPSPVFRISHPQRNDDHSSGMSIARHLTQPTRELRAGHSQALPYLVLLRVGFTKPATSPPQLVSSYLTFSPLPCYGPAVFFLWHFPSGHPGFVLRSTLPCGARTFLQRPGTASP